MPHYLNRQEYLGLIQDYHNHHRLQPLLDLSLTDYLE